MKNTRLPAYAGAFYPAEKVRLASMIDSFLEPPKNKVPALHGLVVPHAGYEYSGGIAGKAYSLLKGKQFKRVVILAANHRSPIFNADIDLFDEWLTPFGKIQVDPVCKELLKIPIFSNPAETEEDEHSVEVQLPFLQRVLNDFTIIPIVVSDAKLAVHTQIAKVLLEKLPDALYIVSTDLSHFNSETNAHYIDSNTMKIFEELEPEYYEDMDACGVFALRVLMIMCRMKGWKPKRIAYGTSADTTGNPNKVVGYCSYYF